MTALSGAVEMHLLRHDYSIVDGIFVQRAEAYYTPREIVFAPASLGGAVPEPQSWALMILGFGFAGGALRRRSRSAVTA